MEDATASDPVTGLQGPAGHSLTPDPLRVTDCLIRAQSLILSSDSPLPTHFSPWLSTE